MATIPSDRNTIATTNSDAQNSSHTHQAKLEQKREQKRRQEAGDSPNEQREMVLHGAELKCPYAQGPGKLVVTSNEILLQDQLFGTEGDGNNMVNLQFDGICGHPKFNGQTRPPCKAVINLTPWYNLGTCNIQEQKALIKASCIDCDPVPNSAIASAIPTAETVKNEDQCNDVINAYWTKDNTGRERARFLPYKKDDKVFIYAVFSKASIGKSYKLTVRTPDLGPDIDIHESSLTIQNEKQIISFDLTGKIFEKGGRRRLNLYFSLEVDGCPEKEFCNTTASYLMVHMIRYIPSIMKKMGFMKGFEAHEKWFLAAADSQSIKKADINQIVKMDWVLQYPRARMVYDAMLAEKIWVNEKGKAALLEKIRSLNLKYPSAIPQQTRFGAFLIMPETVNDKGEVAPPIDLLHYQQRVVTSGLFADPIDDLFAALANFSFRLAVEGTIIKIGNKYRITVQRVGIYVRDSFDFTDDGFLSQPLGYWSPFNEDASKFPKDLSYYYVRNADYQQYRTDTKMGADFLIYSDVKTITVNDSFDVDIGQLNPAWPSDFGIFKIPALQ